MATPSYRALLLVDGYNVIGAWSDLQTSRDRHGLDAARQELIEVLINYTAIAEYRTKIVFDAHYQNTPSNSEKFTSHLSVYYTDFAETADTYIEKICAAFYHRPYQQKYSRLIVATSDRAQQLTAIGYGAEWLSARRLAGEVAAAARTIKRQKKYSKQTTGRFLSSALDPAAQETLQQWRRGNFSNQ
jgi:predicted RNA-binding protein with PIN domain